MQSRTQPNPQQTQRTYRCRANNSSCNSISIGQSALDKYVHDITIAQLNKPVGLATCRQSPHDVRDSLRDARETLRGLSRQYARGEISRALLLAARNPPMAAMVSAGGDLARHLRRRVRDRYRFVPFATLSTPRQRTLIDAHISALVVHPAATTRDPALRVSVQARD